MQKRRGLRWKADGDKFDNELVSFLALTVDGSLLNCCYKTFPSEYDRTYVAWCIVYDIPQRGGSEGHEIICSCQRKIRSLELISSLDSGFDCAVFHAM